MSWLAVVAAVGVASTACAEQSAAIRVGDDTVSEKDFLDELQTLRDNDVALQLIVGATPADITGEMGDDSFGQPFVAYMVEQRVFLILERQLAAKEGIEPSDADLDGVRSQIDDQFQSSGGKLTDLPDGYVDQLVDDLAIGQALQTQLGQDELQSSFVELADRTDVEVSSRFGEWNQDAFIAHVQGQQQQASAVTPPAAPLPSPDAQNGADVGSPAG